jgi:antitoxin (DNA-binding transcriptional repressor) of toxin-antitoxin stability system
MEITVQAGKFKDKCLQLLNDVQRGDTYLITKRGIPFARLSALKPGTAALFGAMKNSFSENGDIIESTGERWNAENE